jgi:hypothetical protein
MMTILAVYSFLPLLLVVVSAQNDGTTFHDRFTYQDTTIDRGDGFFDYRPEDWDQIQCDERTRDTLEQCEGYPYKWHEGIEWGIQDNYCRWCPDDGTNSCGRHHQSPINLLREVGLNFTNPNSVECIGTFHNKKKNTMFFVPLFFRSSLQPLLSQPIIFRFFFFKIILCALTVS